MQWIRIKSHIKWLKRDYLHATSLSDKAIDIYRRLTDLDKGIRTGYSDFVRKFWSTKHCVGRDAIFDKIFYQTFLGFISINETLLYEN